jgi:hypothetical protein
VWVGAVVALVIVAVVTAFLSCAPTPASIRYYRFLAGRDLGANDLGRYDWIIVKGAATPSQLEGARDAHSRLRLINYEQAAALNASEAAFARERGWLALTCEGEEIRPTRIPEVTLMDLTNPAALAWRARGVAEETIALGYDATYLDTLRAFYPVDYYDGIHCIGDLHRQWLRGSTRLVRLVERRTGKLVVANGASGNNYFAHKKVTDRLLAATEAVQIEHFFRSPRGHELDMRLVRRLVDENKLVFVKSDGDAEAAAAALDELPGVFLDIDD